MDSSLRNHQNGQQQQHQQQQQQFQTPYNRQLQYQQNMLVHQQNEKYRASRSKNQQPSQQQQQQNYAHASSGPQHRSIQSDLSTAGSQYSRDSQSAQSSVVDEAYRRLGHRLSRIAHGDRPAYTKSQQKISLGISNVSSFDSYMPGDSSQNGNAKDHSVNLDRMMSDDSSSVDVDRSSKVAKTRYSDHGDHHSHKGHGHNGATNSTNVLTSMTIHATALFKKWETAEKQREKISGRKRSSPTNAAENGGSVDLSPQSKALSQLALESDRTLPSLGGGQVLQNHHHNKKHGLLSAVLETSSNGSSRSSSRSTNSKESLSSKSSRGRQIKPSERGKCLTQPSDPVSNEGMDNAEGNLIMHENDVIYVRRSQIHVFNKERMRKTSHMEFQVQGMLGQGTFAQVFQCQLLQTGQDVAIKVVKNKPAYTRQAAVEIDVFRALMGEESKTNEELAKDESNVTKNKANGSKWDYMVNLICYFMHKEHLCLVFETLGLNLYEVLKKRQFRGLPIPVVRKLVRQAVRGIKELSAKNIVHCDLKPENILLMTDDDLDSVVSAGETKRKPSSFEKIRVASLPSTPSKSRGDPPSSISKDGVDSMTQPLSASTARSPSNSVGDKSAGTSGSLATAAMSDQRIKLIDFGSACFEGQTSHTYIQSRFYRSPEVLVGLPYDSAIDMWSLGCVAAELFLGLPILPGVHEHDQVGRIFEMIGRLPDWMLDQGSKSTKFFVKYLPRSPDVTPSPGVDGESPRPSLPQWRLKSQQEYVASLSQNEIRKKGGLEKLEKQPTTRYFKRKLLSDILLLHGQSATTDDKESLILFVHFLYGILEPDPWKRWTAFQASSHPFLTGGSYRHRKDVDFSQKKLSEENHANLVLDIYWEPPWDPAICRRKLLNVQKMREKQQAARRKFNSGGRGIELHSHSNLTGSWDPNSSSNRHEPSEGNLASRNVSLAARGVVSSSLNDFGRGGVQAVVGGPMNSFQGLAPQSFSDLSSPTQIGNPAQNAQDFAYALQRPGVVPMGGSVSSVDMSLTSGRYVPNGPHGNVPSALQSRSFGEHPQSTHVTSNQSQGASSFSHGVSIAQGSAGQNRVQNSSTSSSLPRNDMQQWSNQVPALQLSQLGAGPSFQSPAVGINTLASSVSSDSQGQQQQMAFGNAHLYLQQQLQQQQLLLQQQQAAIALQQQQLQAFGLGSGFAGQSPLTSQMMGGGPGTGFQMNAMDMMNQQTLMGLNAGAYYSGGQQQVSSNPYVASPAGYYNGGADNRIMGQGRQQQMPAVIGGSPGMVGYGNPQRGHPNHQNQQYDGHM